MGDALVPLSWTSGEEKSKLGVVATRMHSQALSTAWQEMALSAWYSFHTFRSLIKT